MKRIRPLLIAAGVVVLLFAGWWMFGVRAQSLYYSRTLERAQEEGRFEAASDAMETLVRLEPDNRSLRIRASVVLAEGGRFARAEYHLREALALGGPQQAELFGALSALYVRQDKLLDAVTLLDDARGLSAGDAAAMRPAPPEPGTEPGVHERPVSLAFTIPEGSECYYSLTKEYPSVTNLYGEPIELPPGETTVRAVTVDAGGVVSALWTGTYTLDNLNFPVTLREPAIEAAIRTRIGRPEGDLFSRDLTGIESLVLETEYAYLTLEDILLLPQLQTLSLKGDGTDCDISALGGLTGLRRLRLENMGIDSVDLSALEGLVQLEVLRLPGNHLTTLTPLTGLTSLVTLDLKSNSILDVAPLTGMVLVTDLDLSQNSLQDLAPLAPLMALERADLSGNRIVSMDGFDNMRQMRTLNISGNQISNLRALEGLTNLEFLDASRNQIEEVTPLRQLTALTELVLSGNQIGEVTALQTMDALKTLDLASNYIQSIGLLQHCKALVTLNLDKNELSTVEPLRELPKLRELRVESNKLKSLSPLLTCPALKEVYAFGNKLTVEAQFAAKGITVYA